MVNRKFLIIILLLLSGLVLVPTASAANWTYNFSTSYSIDLVNSTYMKDWMYYLIITNSTTPWDFPVIGFLGSIMAPFVFAFSGYGVGSGSILYLILFGLFLIMVWRQSGRVTIPAMISVIVGSGWAMLMPESAFPYALILMSVAIASQVVTWFAKE